MAQSPSNFLVKLDDVSHQFDEEFVLQSIFWAIDRGERWAILGPTGAGKTTLARITAGYLWPNAGGTITRDGRQQYNLSEWRTNVGWLSRDLLERIPANQPLKKTVLAGCLGQTRLAERPDLTLSDRDHQRATTLIHDVNLGPKTDQPFSDLSQGETNLALVARALASNPGLLVLDEPCAGMDPGAREHFLSVLNDSLVNRPATAVIYITHHVEEILPVFGRVLTLREGRVRESGSPQEVITEDHLANLYGVSFDIVRRNQRYWAMT